MIIETVTGFSFWILTTIFDGFTLVTLPLNLLSVLVDFIKYGAFIIGADLFGIVWANIILWLGFKLVAGLILFLYRLIPLT